MTQPPKYSHWCWANLTSMDTVCSVYKTVLIFWKKVNTHIYFKIKLETHTHTIGTCSLILAWSFVSSLNLVSSLLLKTALFRILNVFVSLQHTNSKPPSRSLHRNILLKQEMCRNGRNTLLKVSGTTTTANVRYDLWQWQNNDFGTVPMCGVLGLRHIIFCQHIFF